MRKFFFHSMLIIALSFTAKRLYSQNYFEQKQVNYADGFNHIAANSLSCNNCSEFPNNENDAFWYTTNSYSQKTISISFVNKFSKTYISADVFDEKGYLDFDKYAFIVKSYKSNKTGSFVPIAEYETIVIDLQKHTFSYNKVDENVKSVQKIFDLVFDYKNQIFRANILQAYEISHEITIQLDYQTYYIVSIKHLKSNSTSTFRTQVGAR